MKTLFILFFIIFYLFVNCNGYPTGFMSIGRKFEKNAIIYQYNDYYNSMIERPIMTFMYSDQFGNFKLPMRVYFNSKKINGLNYKIGNFTDEMAKKFVLSDGNVKLCLNESIETSCSSFEFNRNDYPIPMITKTFSPSTRGGIENLQGLYLYFGVSVQTFKIISNTTTNLSKIRPIIIDFDKSTFDATNISFQYPGGCGAGYFSFYSSSYHFYHATPTIDYVLFVNSNSQIYIIGNNFCNVTHIDNITVTINDKIQSIQSIDHEFIILNKNDNYESLLKEKTITIYLTIYGIKSIPKIIIPKLLNDTTTTTTTTTNTNNSQCLCY